MRVIIYIARCIVPACGKGKKTLYKDYKGVCTLTLNEKEETELEKVNW